MRDRSLILYFVIVVSPNIPFFNQSKTHCSGEFFTYYQSTLLKKILVENTTILSDIQSRIMFQTCHNFVYVLPKGT